MTRRRWTSLWLCSRLCACDDVAPPADATLADATTDAARAEAAAPDAAGSDGGAPRYPSPACARDDEAALPDGTGALRCVAVGADVARARGDLDDPRATDPSLPGPLRWVRPGATGGDGSRERPFGTVGEALASLPSTGGTVALSAGQHPVGEPLTARGAVALVGVGAGLTVLAPRGGGLVAQGVGVTLTLRALGVARDASDASAAVDLRVLDGGRAALRDVVFTRPQTAARVEGRGSLLVADGVTVRGARGDGVQALDGARAVLRDAVLRDGGGAGVRGDALAAGGAGGRVLLADALVASNLGGGVVLAGRGEFNTGGDCTAADLAASVGEDDCLLRVAVVGNASVGLSVTEARGAQLRRGHVGATRAGAGGAGDGVFVARGGDLRVDDDFSGMLPEAILGRGTQVLGNARVGVLVDGAGTALRAHGAVIGSNAGSGMLLQRGAHAPAVNACVLGDNIGLGLGVTTGASVAAILCDQFLGTRPGRVGAGMVGDGLSIYGGQTDAIRDNVLSDNARFGLVLSGASPFSLAGFEVLRNTGRGNGYGAGVYGAPLGVFDRLERIEGRDPAPAADPGGASTAL